MKSLIRIALIFCIFSFIACDIPDLQEKKIVGYLKNASTGLPEAGARVEIEVVNDLLGERQVSHVVTNDTGYFEYDYKGAHKFLVFKVEEDKACKDIHCDNRKETDILWYTYSVVDIENIAFNTDTHFVYQADSSLRINFWTYRCGELEVKFQNIASDLDSNGNALSEETFVFCEGDLGRTVALEGRGINDSIYNFNTYADNMFTFKRSRRDSTGWFAIEDSIFIEPGGSHEIIIDQSVIDSRP